jgi:hypothetical protein
MESTIFTTSFCGQMKIHMQFCHHITNSSSPSSSGLVIVVIIYSDPIYFQRGLTEWNYRAFFENNMSDFLASVPLIVYQQLHVMHDAAPSYLNLVAHKYMNQKIPVRWISRGESIVWLPFSPLDLLVRPIKSLVYSSPVDDVKTLQNRIVAGLLQTTLSMPEISDLLQVAVRHQAGGLYSGRR